MSGLLAFLLLAIEIVCGLAVIIVPALLAGGWAARAGSRRR